MFLLSEFDCNITTVCPFIYFKHFAGMHGDSVGGGVAMPSLLKDVERWLKDDQFLLTLVDTLEADPHCTPPKKTEFLSLLIGEWLLLLLLLLLSETQSSILAHFPNGLLLFCPAPCAVFTENSQTAENEKLVSNSRIFVNAAI